MKRHVIVIDIDGVLADVGHRLHHLATRPKDWDSFFADAARDELLDIGAQFTRQAVTTHDVVYLTGRPERLRAATQSWLDNHDLPAGRLIMRRDGDRRPSVAVKMHELRALRRRSRVDLIVDDDERVVAAATADGFAVRHADWMPAPPRSRVVGRPGQDTLFDDEVLDLLHDAQGRDGRT